jgi:hypothetical protein
MMTPEKAAQLNTHLEAIAQLRKSEALAEAIRCRLRESLPA